MRGYHSAIIALVVVLEVVASMNVKEPASLMHYLLEKNPVCPEDKDTVKLPHPTKCASYYICENGERTLHTCPEGLHFNTVIQQCDWPFTSTGCLARMGRPETQPNEPEYNKSVEDPPEPIVTRCVGTCPLPDPMDRTIHLPTSNNCNKFCKCSNGIAFIMDCPGGLHYDRKEQVCNWPWIAKCQT